MAVTPCRLKWKSAMTDRERFNNQMHYRSADRSFIVEFGYREENYREWPLFTENGIKNEADANISFNFDLIASVGGNLWLSPTFPESVVRETATSRVVMHGDGLLAEVPIDGHDSIPHYMEATVTIPDDWKRCKEERFRRDDPARKLDVAAIRAVRPPTRTYPLGVWCGSMIGKIRDVLTFEGRAYATYDYPEMIEVWLRHAA